MKKIVAIALAVAVFSGCIWCTSPYHYVENWLIREDPVRPFAVPADIFYVQSTLHLNMGNVSVMYAYAQSEVGNGRFTGLARVFSPLIANADDLERAIRWYLGNHHDDKRPFIFIGEGEGGRLLHEYEKDNEDDLKDEGLVASFYTETSHKGFVTDAMVKQIGEAVMRAHFRDVWGREMPETMLKE